MHTTFKFFIIFNICIFLLMSACSDSGDSVDGDVDNLESDTETGDGDFDNDLVEGETALDGDFIEEELESPEEQPQPDGVADIEFVFNQQNLSLKDWRVRDKSELPLGVGSSDWSVINEGLVQWANLASTAQMEPNSNTSEFFSSEIRNELQALNPTAIELDFTVGDTSGGIGFSFGSGREQIILCLDENLCGSKFARWQSDNETKAVKEIEASFSAGERYKILLTLSDDWIMLSFDDELLLTEHFPDDATGTVGIINYMMNNLVIHSLSIWGELKSERPRPAVEWSVIAHRGHGNSRISNALPENTTEACVRTCRWSKLS